MLLNKVIKNRRRNEEEWNLTFHIIDLESNLRSTL